ncbi:MAG: cytochrome C oxidase subunit IV family protein [Chloroflexota bacterium]|nr:cytochrome C oxidase subunit IV family protein [Dehalococcoidia bacterium]MDW8046902.1 cytochrome C oxidase subunit IV family protein [Chloroflexota bacterium]
MSIFKVGWIVAVGLAILTIVEYIFAAEVADATARFLGLVLSAGAKAGLIMWFFMHLPRVWRGEEAH